MPNYRNLLRVYKLERELSPDDLALLNTLRGMTDAERELFAETLQPERVVKAPTKERKIEKCVACNWTKRAAVHKDPNADGYHEFQSSKPATKSKRGLPKDSHGLPPGAHDGHLRCVQKGCGEFEESLIHDPKGGYAGHHPFVSPSTAPPATRPSAANGGGENGGVSSGIERETVSSAGAGD